MGWLVVLALWFPWGCGNDAGSDSGPASAADDDGSSAADDEPTTGDAPSPSKADEEPVIELQSGLGGEAGACMFNWCRDNMCHFICLAVPDDRASCDAAIEAYSAIPRQNFLSDEFRAGEDCTEATGTATQCEDPFGSVYHPYGGECDDGDPVLVESGRCQGTLCTGGECSDFCKETDEAGCDRARHMFDDDPSTTTNYTFTAGLQCPRNPGPPSEPTEPAPPTTPVPTDPDECGNCLDACRGLPGCCTGEGCICQGAC
jgi:hypothetical protein